MEKIVKPYGEAARAFRGFDGVAQGHLLEGEEQVGARLYADGVRGHLCEAAVFQHSLEPGAPQRLFPALVRLPLVAALPCDVGLIAKPFGKVTKEFLPAAQSGFSRCASRTAARAASLNAHAPSSFNRMYSSCLSRHANYDLTGTVWQTRRV